MIFAITPDNPALLGGHSSVTLSNLSIHPLASPREGYREVYRRRPVILKTEILRTSVYAVQMLPCAEAAIAEGMAYANVQISGGFFLLYFPMKRLATL